MEKEIIKNIISKITLTCSIIYIIWRIAFTIPIRLRSVINSSWNYVYIN